MRDKRLWLQRALTLTGIACLGWFGYVTVDAAIFQREQAAEFERLRAAQALPGPPAEIVDSAAEADPNLIGMLDIPRLSVSTPVVRGDDDATLKLAAGHLPDTPAPWEPGNSAIAGHRDGLFRPLKDIRVGDDVFLRTTRGDLRYRVRDMKIVTPDDLSVLEQTTAPTLTLITCYPFYFVGSAPKRFVIRADRVDSVAHAASPEVREEPPVSLSSASAEESNAREIAAQTSVEPAKAGALSAPISAEKRKAQKASSRASAGKQKARKSVAKASGDPQKTRKTLSKPSAQPGKVRNIFRKIGGFFKKPKPSPDPSTSTHR